MFRSTAGKLNSDEFITAVKAEAANGGRRFEEHRFYCGDEELLQHNGRTYAITNQRGGRFLEAMDLLIDAFPGEAISYRPSR
jgi:hypothetical protein